MGRKVSIEVPSQGPNHTYKYIIDVQNYDGPVCFGIYEGGWVTVMLKGDQRNLSPLPYTAKRESGDWSGTITVIYNQYTLFISSAENLAYFNNISLSDVTVVGGHLIDGPISQTREEMYPNVAEYFDNYVPGQGVGEVTLQTDAPSQLLTFTSQKLGQSFKYWIRGNQTIELYKPEEHEDEVLWIFKDGQFTDAVKDGFDISQFRSSLARPEGDINALSEWFLTAYALLQGSLYGEPFYIENGYLRKSGNTGSSTSSTGRPVGETNVNFYIPIKRVTGFTKIVYEGITIQNNGTSGGEDYNIISVKAAMVNGSNAFVKSQASGGSGVSQDNWATYEYSISDLEYVDYINLFGCDGSPAYRNIRLVKPGS